MILTGFWGRRPRAERREGSRYCTGSLNACSPVQVFPDGSGQAPAHIPAAKDERPAGEEAGQGPSQHLEEEKERRCRENLKRRLEEEREAKIVQVIPNPAKLKRVKKQQLESIEKPDTLTQLQKPPPQWPAAEI